VYWRWISALIVLFSMRMQLFGTALQMLSGCELIQVEVSD
jgi:hypothetical protein